MNETEINRRWPYGPLGVKERRRKLKPIWAYILHICVSAADFIISAIFERFKIFVFCCLITKTFINIVNFCFVFYFLKKNKISVFFQLKNLKFHYIELFY